MNERLNNGDKLDFCHVLSGQASVCDWKTQAERKPQQERMEDLKRQNFSSSDGWAVESLGRRDG